MLAYEEAKQRAYQYINGIYDLGEDDEIVLLEEESLESENAFIFRYDSRLYIETGNPLFMVQMEYPLRVNKQSGECQLEQA